MNGKTTWFASVAICAFLATPGYAATNLYFLNGVATTELQARANLRDLQLRLEEHLVSEGIAADIDFELSYNYTVCERTEEESGLCLEDFLEAARQILSPLASQSAETQFWRHLLHLDGPQWELFDQLLLERVITRDHDLLLADILQAADRYVSAIGSGKRVILVAHSQGNLLANDAFLLLTPEEQQSVGVVAVATPAPFVAGQGPHRTGFGDPILSVPGALAPNTFVGTCFSDVECHALAAYLRGEISRNHIFEHIVEFLDSLTVPAEGILIDFETFPGPDGILGTADDEPAPTGCEFGICLPLGNQYASLGLNFTSGTLFEGQFFPDAPADNHFVSSEPLDVSFSVPVQSVSVDSFSAWTAVAYALDASGNVITTDTLVHPSPGTFTFFHGTLTVNSTEPIARFVVLPEGCAIGQFCNPILNLDNMVLGGVTH